MKLVRHSIDLQELIEMAESTFGNLVKAVVDINREEMVVDAELHSDQEAFLLNHRSLQDNLWGINLYPHNPVDNFIEFDSLINIRPRSGNRSREVEDPVIREKIISIVGKLVRR